MRRAVVLLVAVATLMMIPVAANAVDASDYEGTWTSKDVDKSNQTLTITLREDGDLDMALVDDGGSFCGDFDHRDRPTDPLVGFGVGVLNLDGTVTVSSYDIVCNNGTAGPSIPVKYTLHRGGNKMSDDTGVKNWIRRRNL